MNYEHHIYGIEKESFFGVKAWTRDNYAWARTPELCCGGGLETYNIIGSLEFILFTRRPSHNFVRSDHSFQSRVRQNRARQQRKHKNEP